MKHTFLATVFCGLIFWGAVCGFACRDCTAETLSAPELDEAGRTLAASFEESFTLALAGIFFLGLALNLTPCIYPMLAVTVSLFGRPEERGHARAFLRAVVYVLGIATMYSVLGVAAAFTGGLFGGLLQSRIVLLVIAGLFLGLALSMFGLFEIKVPSFLARRMAGRHAASIAGVYTSGLFVGIFAAPCIGPPVIGLLTLVGHRGDAMFGFLAFFVLSLGLGLPYLILGTFSGLLHKLPRSGDWMVWVRKAMGVMLTGLGFFYVSLAVGQQLMFVLIPLTLVAGGCYLGFVEQSGRNTVVFRRLKRAVGIGVTVAGVMFFLAGRSDSLTWVDWSEEAEQAVRERALPAVMYFSADWCIPCLEMEVRTFTDEALIRELALFRLLKADLSHYDSPASRQLRERFRIAGVPTIVFLDRGGREIAGERVVGFIGAEELRESVGRVRTILAEKTADDDVVPQEEQETAISEAFLVADAPWIQPGRLFKLGILLRITEGWHTYWQNPGDSGVAAQIAWSLPEGFTMPEAQWPFPARFDDGPFATFGHEDFLLLAAEVLPPPDLEPGSEAVFAARAEWLVCKGICIPQDAEVSLVLKVEDAEPPRAGEWLGYFEQTERLLPVADARWRFTARLEAGAIVLEVFAPEGVAKERIREAEFFPLTPGLIRTGTYSWEQRAGGFALRMQPEGIDSFGESLDGVLVLGGEGEPRALSVNAPVAGK